MRVALLTGALVAALLLAGAFGAAGGSPRTGVPSIELRVEQKNAAPSKRARKPAERRAGQGGSGAGRTRSAGASPAPAPPPAPLGDDVDDDADDDDDRSDDGDDD